MGWIIGGIVVATVGLIVAGSTGLLDDVWTIVQNTFELIQSLLNIIPSPFNIILGVFLTTYLTIILYKAVKK